MEEPSVLDYVKAKLTPWKKSNLTFPKIEAPVEQPAEGLDAPGAETGSLAYPSQAGRLEPAFELQAEAGSGVNAAHGAAPAAPPMERQGRQPEVWPEVPAEPEPAPEAEPVNLPSLPLARVGWPIFSFAALLLALIAQNNFAPPDRANSTGTIFLLLAAGLAAVAYWRREWQPAPLPGASARPEPLTLNSLRLVALVIGLLLIPVVFLACSSNGINKGQFTGINLSLLAVDLVALLVAFWHPTQSNREGSKRFFKIFSRPRWNITISAWGLLLLAATGLVLFFRFYRLDAIPSEMVSDHAEKYKDVFDVLKGHWGIFFPNNGGREALQFYLVSALHQWFGMGFNFLTLKVATSIAGLLALPFLYLLGKEVGSRRIGLLAFTLAGVAYWTNVVSRSGMRLPFYFLFTAATLYFLLRALRSGQTKDFILTGLALGLSFYGYSADRILPLVVVVAVGLFWLHPQAGGRRLSTVGQAAVLVLFAFVVFLPLLGYISTDPTGFSARMTSRMGATEAPLPGPAGEIFFNNLLRALAMFSGSAGVVWNVSIPDYPALGVVSGALFYLGAALVFFRYLRRRHWLDLFLLLAIPLLMLPSILSLAFPNENPNLYRTGGAMVPVFLLVGIALDGLMSAFESGLGRKWGSRLAWAVALLLVAWSSRQEYDLLFNKYNEQYTRSAWNTSEMGAVIKDFSATFGRPENAWLMGYPHWADTRLIALNAGTPLRDYALFIDGLPATKEVPGAKLFIVHPQDEAAQEALRQTYPDGWLQRYVSKVETKDFLIYIVPPES